MELPDEIMDNKRISPFAVRLYWRIKKRTGPDGKIRIAVDALGYHRRKVKSLLDQLVSEGYLAIHDNGRNIAKTYELLK